MPRMRYSTVQAGVEQQVNNGDQCGNDQNEYRNTDFVRNQIAQAGDGKTGECHDQNGGQREHGAVDQVGRDCQQRAQTENLDDTGVLFPDAVGNDFAEFLTGDHRADLILPRRKKRLPVLCDIDGRLAYGLDDSAWRDRGAGQESKRPPSLTFQSRSSVATGFVPSNCMIHGRSLFLSFFGSM